MFIKLYVFQSFMFRIHVYSSGDEIANVNFDFLLVFLVCVCVLSV